MFARLVFSLLLFALFVVSLSGAVAGARQQPINQRKTRYTAGKWAVRRLHAR